MFEDFLHDNGVYEEYMDEFERLRNVSLGAFYKATPSEQYIIKAFEWDKTELGFNFWEFIHNRWIS